MNALDLVWLEDLVRLAEEGNFSRAAQARNLSQPAFSRRIRSIEEWVGTPLVDRDTHRIELTEAGAAFHAVAEEVLRLLAIGREEARGIGRSQAGIVRFAATHALSLTFFPAWLRGFPLGEHAGQVSLVADNMVACERLMVEGRADFLLCHHHPAASTRLDPGNFISLAVGSDELLPVTVPDEERQPKYRLPGTAGEPLPALEFDDLSGMGRIITASNILSAEGAFLRPVVRSHLASVLLAFARDGRGVTWAPRSLASDDLRDGRLLPAGDERWALPVEIRLYRARGRRNASVEEFWRLVGQGAG